MSVMINHFKCSAKHVALLQRHGEENNCNVNLVTVCTTRFVERHTEVARFWKCLPTIVIVLQEMEKWTEIEAITKASIPPATLE